VKSLSESINPEETQLQGMTYIIPPSGLYQRPKREIKKSVRYDNSEVLVDLKEDEDKKNLNDSGD
jgi:hypothetical protein